MNEHNAVVAIYNTHTEAEAAIKGPTRLKKINKMTLRNRPMSSMVLQRFTRPMSYIGQ